MVKKEKNENNKEKIEIFLSYLTEDVSGSYYSQRADTRFD